MKGLLRALTLALVALAARQQAHSQALATATGPGSYLALGGGFSGFNTDYGHHHIAGAVLYAEANPQWRIGMEGEARFLRWHTQEQITESTYLGGPRIMLSRRPGRYEPYAKFLAGAGRITLPYGYAHGTFFTYAPGAGLDIGLTDRWSCRAFDFEYQRWPQFPYGSLSPYGISAGVTLRLNGVSRYPRGARAGH